MGRPQTSKADLHPVGQNRPTPQENHPQKAEEKHRADRTRPLRHPHSRRRRTLDPKRMGRTLKLDLDTPSKTPRSCRYPSAGVCNLEEVAYVVFETTGSVSVIRMGASVDPRLLEHVRR